jgi:hypothetical protein
MAKKKIRRIVRKRKPATLETIEKRRETVRKKEDEKREAALAVFRAARTGAKKKLTERDLDIREMAAEYEAARETYKGGYKRIFPLTITPECKHYATLDRAVKFAKELDVDFSTYIKALFFMAHKWGNRAPYVAEIGSYKSEYSAKNRVAMYLEMSQETEVADVVGPVMPSPHIPDHVIDRQCERQLAVFMKEYGMSEEEVLLNFANGQQAHLYFDRRWLLANPTYSRLLRDGKV